MRRPLLAAGVLAGVLCAPSVHADPHPYFQDQGTLVWSTCLDTAQAAARKSDRLVFIEFGRRECRNCRILVERILPGVRDRISAACVGLAADCDEPDPRVAEIFRRAMPDAGTLPFVAIVTPDLRYVTGWEGGVGADDVVRHLAAVEAVQRTMRQRTAAAACPSTRAPVAVDATTRPMPAGALPVGPSAPARPVWTQADATRARDLLAQAQAAAARGAHGDVLRLDAEAAALPVRADPAAWKALVVGAAGWCERALGAAVDAARGAHCDEAARWVAAVRREMAGRPAAADAERGAQAIDLAHRLAETPPGERAKVLRLARETYRGTRWAALFDG